MLKLKLDQLMTEKEINARQLSELTGIRWNTIDDMAKNKSKTWSVENLEKITKVLEIGSINELIEYKREVTEE